MIQENEILAKLADVESGNLAIWEFQEWIEEASFGMHRDSLSAAMELVGGIGLIFADYDRRIASEQEVRQKLIALLYPVEVFECSANAADVVVTPVLWSGAQDFAPSLPHLQLV